MDKVIIRETPAFRHLVFRKSKTARIIEIIAFLIGMMILLGLEGGYTTEFKVHVFILAFVIVVGRPLLYSIIVKPEYTLTEKALSITKNGKTESYALGIIEKEYDLPFVYTIGGKKQELMVSDTFIDALNSELEKIKKQNKKK